MKKHIQELNNLTFYFHYTVIKVKTNLANLIQIANKLD